MEPDLGLIRRRGARHPCSMATRAERAVGRNVARKDGIGKATGTAVYADDLVFPGMIWGRTIRAEIPCGQVRGIHRDFDESAFTVVDYRDIPGRNVIALIEYDQPCLVEREVRHAAEPILLLAHADREQLNAARVTIDYEPSVPLLDAEQSNVVFKHIHIEKGDVDAGLREPVGRGDFLPVLVEVAILRACASEVHRERQHLARVEPELETVNGDQGSRHQSGAHQQHDGQTNLRHKERGAEPSMARRPDRSGRSFVPVTVMVSVAVVLDGTRSRMTIHSAYLEVLVEHDGRVHALLEP